MLAPTTLVTNGAYFSDMASNGNAHCTKCKKARRR